MNWNRIAGIVACIVLIVSCFIPWAYYPDIKENFTGFYSKLNYYGKPGKLLLFFAITGLVFYYLRKAWSDRLNMIFGALATAYAITSFLRFTSSYDGFLPEKRIGIFLMLFAAIAHMVFAVMLMSVEKTKVPVIEKPV